MIPFGQSHVLIAFKKKKRRKGITTYCAKSMAAGIKQLTLYSLFYLVSTDERIVFSFLKLWKLRCESMINYRCMHVRALSCFGHVRLFATLWTAASQASLSMGFSRQGYWTGLPCPPPGDLPDPRIKLACPVSPA